MKSLAAVRSVHPTLDALDRALGECGASSLDRRVPPEIWRRALVGPAEEFLGRPGKELRSSMVRTGCTLAGSDGAALPDRLALVIELLHAGSLVIDDVEDGSLERRGAPALHQLVGVPLAINTGNWMYFWALAEISSLGLAAEREAALFRAACDTHVRCHQGQALDLAVRITDVALADVTGVVAATTSLKTGTLCALATSIGAIAAGSPPPVVEACARFGASTGAALQMLDDLGSLASPARRDKGREDLRNQRPTWVWAWLAEVRPFAWTRLVAQLAAPRTDADLDLIGDALVAEVEDVGRQRIRALLDDTLADLVARAGDGPAIAKIGAALSRMEKSYG